MEEKNIIKKAKKCPFCGSKNVEFISNLIKGYEKEFVVCMNEQCLAEGGIASTKEEALKKWNTRN